MPTVSWQQTGSLHWLARQKTTSQSYTLVLQLKGFTEKTLTLLIETVRPTGSIPDGLSVSRKSMRAKSKTT